MEPKEKKKISFAEYKKKYTYPERKKLIKSLMILGAFLVGVIIAFCLVSLTLKVFEFNQYAGYAAIGVSALLFVLFYIVPLIKIGKTRYFITNVDELSGARAKRHNRKVRHELADKMIEVANEVDDISWYSKALVGELEIAKEHHDEELLKNTLTEIYAKDVKKVANDMIVNHAVQVGLLTAISPSEKLDTMFVALFNLGLIKDIVTLYGFRPNDKEMGKIFLAVIRNTLLAYGVSVGSDKILTAGTAGLLGEAASKIPFIGGIIQTLVVGASQGVINGLMTVLLGNQVQRYLIKEYKLQDVLDGFVFEDDEEEEMKVVKKEINERTKKVKKDKKDEE